MRWVVRNCEAIDTAVEVLDHGSHELKLLLAELRHEWEKKIVVGKCLRFRR